ncbi:MAG: NAAT family transporter [Opitutales bacterium]
MNNLEFLLLSYISIFAILNPFSVVPAFLAMTREDSVSERIEMARRGSIVAAIILLIIAMTGQWVFQMLGITLPALQIAGGIILFVIGFEMLRAPEAPRRLNDAECDIAQDKEDIAITPLAIPLLCGPGAISTVIILQTQAIGWIQSLCLLIAVTAVYISCYLILALAASGAKWLTPIILKVLRRLMGLLFAIIAAQFVINGIGALPFIGVNP